jgi:hypothetical protein
MYAPQTAGLSQSAESGPALFASELVPLSK